MKITIFNQKGGAGKTMITMLLAMALADTGRKVGVVDLDYQGTASIWAKSLENPNIVVLDDAKAHEECDFILFDTPPKLGDEVVSAIRQSDMGIMVTTPAPSDAWSAKETVMYLKKKIKKTPLKILFNRVSKGKRSSQNLDLVAEKIGLEALKTQIHDYAAYEYSPILGWDSLKKKEIDPLVRLIMEIMENIVIAKG